jgi:hypothetical protein
MIGDDVARVSSPKKQSTSNNDSDDITNKRQENPALAAMMQ